MHEVWNNNNQVMRTVFWAWKALALRCEYECPRVLWVLIQSSNNLNLNLPLLHGSHKSMSLGATPLSHILVLSHIFCYQSGFAWKFTAQRSENYPFFITMSSFPNNLHSLKADVLIATKRPHLFLTSPPKNWQEPGGCSSAVEHGAKN